MKPEKGPRHEQRLRKASGTRAFLKRLRRLRRPLGRLKQLGDPKL
jgi:hypothetical protein